jgi:DNA-binding PadR family transcriptional regulator
MLSFFRYAANTPHIENCIAYDIAYIAASPLSSRRMRQTKDNTTDDTPFSLHGRLHSAPKGLLRHYILNKIAQKPIHGYEIIHDIDSKTEGAWRPGAGSLYPILKSLESEGLIKPDQPTGEETRKVYHITPRGSEALAESRETFNNFQQRWGFMRKLFVELIPPKQMTNFFVDGYNRGFQIAQDIIESKKQEIPKNDLEYMLKEYVLSLERQLSWANQKLSEMKPRLATATARQKRAKGSQ